MFVNSKNSKSYDPRRLLLNLLNKINLKRRNKYVVLLSLAKRRNKYVVLLSLAIYCTWKDIKTSYKNIILNITSGME